MDKLEKFITENREAFDREMPSPRIWAGIEQALEARKPAAKVRPLYRILSAAAAAILLIGLGSLIGVYAYKSMQVREMPTLASLAPEYAEAERYYASRVNNRMRELSRLDQETTVEKDIKQLDDIYAELQRELDLAPKASRDKIIQAMIRNYQIKLDILERVLEKVQTTHSKTTSHETSI
jgi:hypothetical protein